jgi:GxxExxY protein
MDTRGGPTDETTRQIIGAFYTVYNGLRFGFSESVYANAMTLELRRRGVRIAREVSVQVRYRDVVIAIQRLDMIVNGHVVVEIKSTEILHSTAHRQLLSYLKGSKLEVGLLLHFGPQARFYRIVSFDPRLRRPPSGPPADSSDSYDPIQ